MEGVEKLWEPESPVESLRAVIAEFYRVLCETSYAKTPEDIVGESMRNYVAYACRCENIHVIKKDVWSSFRKTIRENTPTNQSAEYEEYVTLAHSFFHETNELDMRKVMEPLISNTDEGKLIEEALSVQLERMNELAQAICSSEVTLTNCTDMNHLTSFECAEHQTTHYLKPNDYNMRHKSITAEGASSYLRGEVSNLAFRILAQKSSAAHREFMEKYPPVRVPNTNRTTPMRSAEEREQRRIGKANLRAKKQEKAIAKSKKERLTQKEAPFLNTFDNPNLYILKPSLMSEEWLIEYNVCGRKNAFSSREEAEAERDSHYSKKREVRPDEEKEAYACSYCSQWHYGRTPYKRRATKNRRERQARNGLFWYKKDYKKANIFIHKIIFEDWDK